MVMHELRIATSYRIFELASYWRGDASKKGDPSGRLYQEKKEKTNESTS